MIECCVDHIICGALTFRTLEHVVLVHNGRQYYDQEQHSKDRPVI